MSLLPTIRLDEIPVDKATPLSGLAIVGEVSQKEIANGYTQISVPLFYVPANDPQNGVAPTDYSTLTQLSEIVTDIASAKEAGLKHFTARWNVKGEWFEHSFLSALRANQVDQTERTMYNINVVSITRGLFKSAGLGHVDFEAIPPGTVVGFKAASSKKEPDRLQIRLFYPPKRS